MQVVQELKFTFDTKLDPEIEEALETLVYLVHSKNQMIKDNVTPNRGGATIVNRQNNSDLAQSFASLQANTLLRS